MAFISLGLNHHCAPVDIRERAAFNESDLPRAFEALKALPEINEAVILSTCNRTELYLDANGQAMDRLVAWMHEYFGAEANEFTPYLLKFQDTDAVQHLLQVCAGLDSLVLGEPQIFGQVKHAFAVGQAQGAVGPELNNLFQQVFAVAKQVRTETEIGANPVSVAYAAVHLSKKIFADIHKKRALLIGAGETIELVGRHLQSQGVTQFIIANRSIERAQKLADELGGEALTLPELPSVLHRGDMVFSSTASPLPILGKGAVETALRKRKNEPMLMIDIAVPRDIEAEVKGLDDVLLYTVDDLAGIIDAGRAAREAAAQKAREIIKKEAQAVVAKMRANSAKSVIKYARAQAQALQNDELERARAKLQAGERPEYVIDELAHRLVQKFMHKPSQAMSAAALKQDFEFLDNAKTLFGLQDPE